jgi:hypothetical protein
MTARFVRKVSRIFQVVVWPCGGAASLVAGRPPRRLDRLGDRESLRAISTA